MWSRIKMFKKNLRHSGLINLLNNRKVDIYFREILSTRKKNLNCDESCFLVCGLLASNIWDFFRSQHSQSKKLKSHKRTLSQKSNNGKGKKGERGLNKSRQKNPKTVNVYSTVASPLKNVQCQKYLLRILEIISEFETMAK